MGSVSLIDFLSEKIHSYSSKMRPDSLQQYNSFLMAGNSVQQYDPVRILNELREYGVFENTHHRTILFNEVLEIFSSYQNLKHLYGFEKPEVFCNNTFFSPHFLNLIDVLNSFSYKSSVMPLLSHSSSISENLNILFAKTSRLNLKANSDLEKACVPASELKMSESILPVEKKADVTDKMCSVSARVKLNVKLANRKTKQINKRSRNRRRRQKKMRHSGSVSQSSSDDDDCDGNLPSSISNSVCYVPQSPDFECTVTIQHTVQKPTLVSSFVMTVESDSDDDSEWESYDETDNCNVTNMNLDNILSSNSSPVNSDSTDSCSSSSDDEMNSNMFSFVVPVDDSCDDDSDWDTCDTDAFTGVAEFEFTGLFVTNLGSFHSVPSIADCKSKIDSSDETDECLQLRKELLDANKKWNKLTDGDRKKSASKVKFAADEDLVEVFHIEMVERKGEWETYATERIRFKRRINELEKVISPCFNLEHRSKVFKKLIEPQL